MDSEKTQNICRACLTEEGTFQSVFRGESNSGISLHISEMLSNCANIQVTVGDGLPDQICILCAEVTVEMYLFKLRCEKSDKILRRRLEKLALRDKENLTDNGQTKSSEVQFKPEIIDNLLNETFIEEIGGFDSCDGNKSDSDEEIKTTKISEEIDISRKDSTLKKFECDICQKQFNQENLLVSHKTDHFLKMNEIEIKEEDIQVNHNSINEPAAESEEECLFSCPECEFYFVEKEYLDSHINSWHKINKPAPSNEDIKQPIEAVDVKQGFNQIPNLKDIKMTAQALRDALCPLDVYVHLTRLSSKQLCRFEIAEKPFLTSQGLESHQRIRPGEKPYQCPVCKRPILLVKTLLEHNIKHLNSKQPLKCELCHKTFSTRQNFTVHQRSHTGEKPFECDVCQKKIASSMSLKQHKRLHTGDNLFECDICHKKLVTRHVLTIHKIIHTGKKPFKCEVCKKGFTNNANMRRHRKGHFNVKWHECDICDKRFNDVGNMRRHRKIHLHEKEYECDICRKVFARLETLRKHKVMHTGENAYECDVCKKNYANLASLKLHKIVHTGEKPFGCDICPKRFTQMHTLETHKAIHTGAKPHKCDVCKKTFSTLSYLNGHKKSHMGKTQFQCDICKKKLSSLRGLVAHRKNHKDEDLLECKTCMKVFLSLRGLRSHEMTHASK